MHSKNGKRSAAHPHLSRVKIEKRAEGAEARVEVSERRAVPAEVTVQGRSKTLQ